jgi:hypothetical protein
MELDSGIKAADGNRMLAAMEQLDVLMATGAVVLDPRLAHFIERRSYAKALAWIEGEGSATIPAGNCAPRAGTG